LEDFKTRKKKEKLKRREKIFFFFSFLSFFFFLALPGEFRSGRRSQVEEAKSFFSFFLISFSF